MTTANSKALPWQPRNSGQNKKRCGEHSSDSQAIQAVINTAIEYNRETANSPFQTKTLPPVKLRVPGMSQIAMLPCPERAVYFLRGILHYSCEETGLLLDLSNVQIDQLYKFAAKRVGYASKTACR
jgi:DNA-directed RNA polymerase specialized sigma24 family protein